MAVSNRTFSRDIVRHAYDESLNALSRLSAFAQSKPRGEGPVDGRQERLVLDDLVTFAIHARRLIHSTLGKKNFASVQVPQLTPLQGSIAITEVIDALIHNEDVEIIRSHGEYSLLTDPPADVYEMYTRLASQCPQSNFRPIVSVKSDRGLRCVIYLAALTDEFEGGVLQPIIDRCAEQHLFLEDEIRDP